MTLFAELLAGRDVVLDGGLATELEARGHDLSDALWSARVLRDDPQAIEDVHVSYFEAGADVATTSSYQTSFEGFEARGIDRDEAARLLRLSVELAQRARDRTGGTGVVRRPARAWTRAGRAEGDGASASAAPASSERPDGHRTHVGA